MKKLLLAILFTFFILNSFAQDNYYNSINPKYWTISNNKNISIDSCSKNLNNIYNLLFNNNIIPNPFINDNELRLSWIDSTSWTYSTNIKLNKKDLNLDNIFLILGMIDTYSSIYLNDKLIGHTNNEFLEYRFNIKPYLREGENEIKITIEPAIDKLNYISKDYNTLESEKRVISRKAQYRYGWDWHPKMLSCGISDIYIESYNKKPKIEYYNIQTLSISDNKANLIFNIGVSNLEDKNYKIIIKNIQAYNPNHPKEKLEQSLQDISFDINNKSKEINEFTYKFIINSPHIWNTKTNGEQYLYKASLNIVSEKLILNEEEISFGIRTIELIQENDSIGQSFYFKLNGKPLFIKGANYIAKEDKDTKALELAKDANMNMLRVWGGSRYANNDFYNYCNENGILVWQDFPFACALYPGDSYFLENVKKEAEQNIRKIANNPSLALFCGNNEIWEGWMNWGWKKEVNDTIKAVENYNKLFNKILPEAIKKYSPTINYIHTSPLHGWGRKESLTHGDCHYWGVWWADSTLETYTRKIPRFMSEFGFQGAPNINTAKAYMSLPYSKENQDFSIHQKHPRGFELIDNRINEYFNSYKTDEDYIYKSQVVQQEAYKIAIEAQRRAKPYCMGTLFWQLNDAYPAISWSAIDYSGYKKPVYYTIKKAFEPIILSIDNISNKDSVFIYYCNDIDSKYSMGFKATIYDNNGFMRYSKDIKKLDIKNNKSEKILSICLSNIKDFNPKTDYLYVEGNIGGKTIDNHTFFCKPKDYIRPSSKPIIKKVEEGSNKGIYLISKEVIRNIVIEEVDNRKDKGNMIIDLLPHKDNLIDNDIKDFKIVEYIRL
ncbi:MAG: sugar-binding domain-containing protein [Bacteroidales bacterium]